MKQHSNYSLKRSSALLLKAVIALVGICALAVLLWLPQLEGRNVNASFSEIYFHDPFLAYVYVASVPFFVALFQAVRLAGYASHGKAFSPMAANAWRAIKRCAFITAGAVVAADIYLSIAARGRNDDPAGAIMLGIIVTFASLAIGIAAARFERAAT